MKSYEINFETIPPNLEPNENITLWRYMSFSSLYEILINDYIPLISARNFSDKAEGSVLKAILSKLPNANEDSIEYLMEEYLKNIYISSWHKANNENAAMWDRYTHGGEGIAIKTNAKLLLGCMKRTITPHQIFSDSIIEKVPKDSAFRRLPIIKPIKYTDNKPTDFEIETKYLENGYDRLCFFYKLNDFQDESEVRILAGTQYLPYQLYDMKSDMIHEIKAFWNEFRKPGNNTGSWNYRDSMQLKINSSSKLIQQIIVSPYAHSQFIKTVEQSIENINLSRQADPIKCEVTDSRRKEWI